MLEEKMMGQITNVFSKVKKLIWWHINWNNVAVTVCM